MVDHKFLDLLPSYAAGALGSDETRQLEEHLRGGCEICDAELYVLCETASRIPYALPDHPIPAGLKEKLRSRVNEVGTSSTRKSPARWSTLIAVAAVLLLVVASLLIWRAQIATKSLESTLALQKQQIERLEKTLLSQKNEIQWLRDPAVQLALLTGLDVAPGARARMIWHPEKHKGILYVQSVPPLAPDKSYQLWVIGNKGPVSAGVFAPDTTGKAVVNVKPLAGADGSLQFAVTIEPRGGVPQPTGSMILAGKPI